MVAAVVVYKIKATTSTISTTTITNATNTTMHAKRNIVIIITATLTRDISNKTIQQSPSIPYHHHNHHYNPITTMTQHTLSYSTLISIKRPPLKTVAPPPYSLFPNTLPPPSTTTIPTTSSIPTPMYQHQHHKQPFSTYWWWQGELL